MALSKSAIRELESELKHARSKRTSLEKFILGLESILNGTSVLVDDKQMKYRQDEAGNRIDGIETKVLKKATVRELLKKVLEEKPNMQLRQLTSALEERGYAPPGQTKLTVRVNNELWRMKKVGLVTKTDSGAYSLT